ncbi:outer membrane protein assembly factor BamB family protein [Cellulomonas aerilata]|nr:PQQ-binding-like beta-propeller repeat protein [Cellulomonas aerilata]
MVAARHVMVEVELVEGHDGPGARHPRARPLPEDDLAPVPGRPGTRHRPRRWVAGILLVVLTVTSGRLAADAQARSAMAALAAVDGVLHPLDGPVAELWRSEGGMRPELLRAAGMLVAVVGGEGSADVVALDPATGATVWRAPLRGSGPGDGGGGIRCVVPGADRSGGAGGPAGTAPPTDGAAGPGGAPVVVCVVDRFPPSRRVPPAPDGTTLDRLVVLDARTGAVVSQRPVDRSTTVAALDGDVVVAHGDDDGYVHVTRTDPLGTRVRWAFVSPRPLPVRHPGWSTRMDVVEGLVVVDESDGWVLDGRGDVLRSWAGTVAAQAEGTAHLTGGRLLTRPHTTGGPYARTRVTDLVSGTVFTVRGRPLESWPDDGSLDGSMLARAGHEHGLAAYDPATGTRLWTAPGQVEGRAMVLDGRVVRLTPQGLVAVDGRSGATLWQTRFARPARSTLVTDGRLVVVTQLDGDRGLVLGAYGLDDGRLRWTADLADDIAALTVAGRQLFGWSPERLVALTPPG